MEIVVKRIARRPTYTIGRLYVDGNYVCDTLEDVDRGLTQLMSDPEVRAKKIHGKTAIPTGTYQVSLAIKSARFGDKPFYKNICGGFVPRLLGVKGFDGVLIHCGNTDKDTEGCILVGYNKEVGKVVNSQAAFEMLYKKYLLSAKKNNEHVTIKIC
jgi:hypothetical protein